MVNKIHIFGGPGSGKTTLATKLSEELNIPHYDLDKIRYKEEDKDYSLDEDEKIRDEKLKKILSKKKWITEGSYTNFAWPCFEKAEKIIFLEPSMLVTNYRIIKRFILYKLGIVKLPKKQRWGSLPELIRWNYTFNYQKLPKLKERLKPIQHKIIIVNTDK